MKRKLLVLVLGATIFVLLGFNLALSQYGNQDTLWLERIQTVSPNSQVVYSVYLYNDENLSGFAIPFVFPDMISDMDISLDSVSWVGTRASGATMKNSRGDADSWKADSTNVVSYNRIQLWAVFFSGPLGTVTRAQALATPLGKIYFRTGSSWTSPNYVPVDTASWEEGVGTTVSLELSSELGAAIPDPYIFKGALDVTDITTPSLPRAFAVYQNYPNPFNPSTTIRFDLAKDGEVTLEIYNVLGQKVKTLIDHQNLPGGTKEVEWNSTDDNNSPVASGAYFYQIITRDDNKVTNKVTRKMVLTK